MQTGSQLLALTYIVFIIVNIHIGNKLFFEFSNSEINDNN